MSIGKGTKVHLVGIGGAGMSGIAVMLMQMGAIVTGSDIDTDREQIAALQSKGIMIFHGHDVQNIEEADLVVASSAIKSDNPEVLEAKAKGIETVHRTDVFPMMGLDKRIVGVAGSHGKTTTTAMIAHIATLAGLEPSYYFGSPFIGGEQARYANPDLFIMETDESDHTFLKFHCDIAVVTNIDRDHMEAYGHSFESLVSEFGVFLNQSYEKGGWQIVNADDPSSLSVKLPDFRRVMTYGGSPLAHFLAKETSYFLDGFRLCTETPVQIIRKSVAPLRLNVPGRHNVMDALAAIAACTKLGLDPEESIAHLASYPGTWRRLELVGQAGGHPVYDDYAHHPTAIKASLSALRHYYPQTQICLVLQPFRYARASYLPKEYAECVRTANRVLVTDIFPQALQEQNLEVAKNIIESNPEMDIKHIGPQSNVANEVAKGARPGEVVYLSGPYPIRSEANSILESLK